MSLKRYGIIVVFLGWAFTAYSDAQKNVGRLFPVKQVVIWGYPLHSHTHSYIHNGFFRAFKHLGYKTLWLTDADDTRAIDFKDTLFLTMGDTANKKMPLRMDCFYIFHNGEKKHYQALLNARRAISMQVYTHDCLSRTVTKVSDCIYYDF